MSDKTLKILHVEDNFLDSVLIKEMLNGESTDLKFEIVHVDSLRAALEKLEKEKFDTILLDLHLKDVQGIENVDAIQGENFETPVIALTGMNNYQAAAKAIKFGAQDYLVKSNCNENVLKHSINNAIEKKKNERQLYLQANYDNITGLPNRHLFIKNLEKTIKRSNGENINLVFINITNLNDINNKYGFEAGSSLVTNLAIKLKNIFNETDTVSRFDTCEFIAIVGENESNKSGLSFGIASKLLKLLNESFEFNDREIDYSANVNVSFYPLSNIDPDKLHDEIESYLTQAKKSSGIFGKSA